MKLNDAILIVMQSASRDVRGSGMGYRSTSDEWRVNVLEAWAICFKHIYKREPTDNDYYNAGMK
jgi:hypothetical protein